MRPAIGASVVALVGCIGTNPEWNTPHGSVVGSGDTSTGSTSGSHNRGGETMVLTSAPSSDPSDGHSDDGSDEAPAGTSGNGSTTGTSPAASSSDGGDTATVPDEGGADGAPTDDGAPPSESGGDPPPPPCAPNEQLCAGVCTEIDHDKHACGPDCIDCTDLYGNTAKCEDGECEPHGGHGDGGEGKGG